LIGHVKTVKSKLVRELSEIKGFDNPKISLEQYMTPPQLAADILHTAYMNHDLESRKIADFGTGTGMLAVGAAILGAEVTAFDKDSEAIKIARENAEKKNVESKINFREEDVLNLNENFDSVVMNPPFSVHSESGIGFFKKAFMMSEAVYAVSHPGSRELIKDFVRKSNHVITALEGYKISLPATYGFHTEEDRETEVDVIITKKDD